MIHELQYQSSEAVKVISMINTERLKEGEKGGGEDACRPHSSAEASPGEQHLQSGSFLSTSFQQDLNRPETRTLVTENQFSAADSLAQFETDQSTMKSNLPLTVCLPARTL